MKGSKRRFIYHILTIILVLIFSGCATILGPDVVIPNRSLLQVQTALINTMRDSGYRLVASGKEMKFTKANTTVEVTLTDSKEGVGVTVEAWSLSAAARPGSVSADMIGTRNEEIERQVKQMLVKLRVDAAK